MAINIYKEPTSGSPYRPFFFDVSSDLGTITRMIADVYVDSTLESTIESDPLLGETDLFRFEVGDVLKKYLISEFDKVTSQPETFDQTTSIKPFYIRAFEVEDNGTTLDTSWSEDGAGTNYTQSTTIYAFNSVLQHNQKDDVANYLLSNSTKLFNTNMPQNTYIGRNQYFYLGGVAASGVTYKARLREYTGVGGTGSNSATDSSTVSPTNRKIAFGCDTSLIATTDKSFSLTAYDSGSTQKSEDFIVNLKDSCDDDVVLYWQNHYGYFDSFTFTGAFKQKTKTRTKQINKRLTADYAFEDRATTDISKENEREYQIYSTSERASVIKWLAEIGESVDVRVQETINGTRETIPINVKKVTSRIEDSDRGVHQISITYVKSSQRINQLG